MAFSVGVWARGAVAAGTVYRWEADEGRAGSGFVVFDAESRTVRPCDEHGSALGSFVVDAAGGETSGVTAGVDQPLVLKVAVGILKAYGRGGEVPETAHVYYG